MCIRDRFQFAVLRMSGDQTMVFDGLYLQIGWNSPFHRCGGQVEDHQQALAIETANECEYRLGRVEETDIAPLQRRQGLAPMQEPARGVERGVRIALLPLHGQRAMRLGDRQQGGLPVVNPACALSSQGIGVRQPSRPLKFGQKALPYGSCNAS